MPPRDRLAWWDDDPGADIVLLPCTEMAWLNKVDVVFAAHCLGEMSADTVASYIALIDRLRPSFYWHDSPHTSFVGPRKTPMTFEAFPELRSELLMPHAPYREVYRAPTTWSNTGSRYWEFLYERAA